MSTILSQSRTNILFQNSETEPDRLSDVELKHLHSGPDSEDKDDSNPKNPDLTDLPVPLEDPEGSATDLLRFTMVAVDPQPRSAMVRPQFSGLRMMPAPLLSVKTLEVEAAEETFGAADAEAEEDPHLVLVDLEITEVTIGTAKRKIIYYFDFSLSNFDLYFFEGIWMDEGAAPAGPGNEGFEGFANER